jgi:hypothetical protein
MPTEDQTQTPRLDSLITEMEAAGRREDDILLNLAKGVQTGFSDLRDLLKGDEEEMDTDDMSDVNQMAGDGGDGDADKKANKKAKGMEGDEDDEDDDTDGSPGFDDMEKGSLEFDVTEFVLGLDEKLSKLDMLDEMDARLAKAEKDNAELRQLVGKYIAADMDATEMLTKAVVTSGMGIEAIPTGRQRPGAHQVRTAQLRHADENQQGKPRATELHDCNVQQLAKARSAELISASELRSYRKTGAFDNEDSVRNADLVKTVSAINFDD